MTQQTRLINALGAEDSSVRLQSALAAGSDPDPVFLEPLVERCAVDPDFFEGVLVAPGRPVARTRTRFGFGVLSASA
ncbi:hypothetical protein [Streptomyces sp. NPDC012510]|uniref:hypothetical protein n=1 Tax=Streptomyces sp. NPDC012510 TaxID=3364838 RepID=UPI0036E793EC